MNLSEPASAVIPENVSRILKRLSLLTEPISGRRIHELAGTSSLKTAQRILARIESAGLVSSTPSGPSRLYVLNREHILWNPLRQLLTALERFEEELSAEVRRIAPQGTHAVIFGSLARGTATESSDVDLLVVMPDDALAESEVHLNEHLTNFIERRTGNTAQVICVFSTDLRRMRAARDPLMESWRNEGRLITDGPSLSEVLEKV